MPLKINMLKAPESVSIAAAPVVIGEQGGTLGRGAENTVMLEDPELYLSSLHCQISFENGQYYLVDHSTNGTFYAGAHDPMGKGTRLPVYDNDRFVIGDYEFSISIDNQSAPVNDPFADSRAADVFAQPVGGDGLDGFASNPNAGGHIPSREPLFNAEPGESDPLVALDKARGTDSSAANLPGPDPFAAPTHSDGANSLNQQIEWPQPVVSAPSDSFGVIPDNWDDDGSQDATDLTRPVAAADSPAAPQNIQPDASGDPGLKSIQQELEQANASMQAELDQLKRQISGQQVGSAPNQVDTTFIAALGLERHHLSDQEVMQINQLGGEVLREMIVGLMQVLGSRSSIKNEFRMNVTTIQPVENNPLKFSANVDDALENMFIKQGNAFKKPIESVREGFEGVAEHQLAILAGIREAYKAVVERFDPVMLEQSFSKQNRGGLLPGSQKAKNWEFYVDYYEELAGDIDKSFQYLFGDGFVRAYEDQLQKLAVSRKSKKFNNEN